MLSNVSVFFVSFSTPCDYVCLRVIYSAFLKSDTVVLLLYIEPQSLWE